MVCSFCREDGHDIRKCTAQGAAGARATNTKRVTSKIKKSKRSQKKSASADDESGDENELASHMKSQGSNDSNGQLNRCLRASPPPAKKEQDKFSSILAHTAKMCKQPCMQDGNVEVIVSVNIRTRGASLNQQGAVKHQRIVLSKPFSPLCTRAPESRIVRVRFTTGAKTKCR
jgi:hypothetical protein